MSQGKAVSYTFDFRIEIKVETHQNVDLRIIDLILQLRLLEHGIQWDNHAPSSLNSKESDHKLRAILHEEMILGSALDRLTPISQGSSS